MIIFIYRGERKKERRKQVIDLAYGVTQISMHKSQHVANEGGRKHVFGLMFK